MTIRPAFTAPAVALSLFLLITLGGCPGPTPPPIPVATSIVVSPASTTLTALGATVQFSAQVKDQDGQAMTGVSVSWHSSNPSVAQVNPTSGLVTAASVGTTTVIATSGTASGQASVTVLQVVAGVTAQAGSGQVGYINEALPVNPAVRVTDSGGHPIPGVQVTFAIRAGGGSVGASTAITASDGRASTTWTLGPTVGAQTLRASAGSVFAEFSATGQKRPPKYAVLVYMAADNNLSIPGILDIDEMEAVGSTDEVVILVQAEFSPVEMGLIGCTPACFNRPNYNTFRYKVEKGDQVYGPDGPAQDIGNRDMTDPAQLADFVSWAKTNHAADKYILVLWNHGGGYMGLIEDQTSATDMMTLDELRAGLALAGTRFAVIDFDMCLMGAIETAVSIDGYADYVVFSEETEPGDGNPYDTMLQHLVANPSQTPAQVAQMFVDKFVASYRGTRNSVTKSALDMSQLGSIVNAWDALGIELAANLPAYQGSILPSAVAAQAYTLPYLKDLGHWLSHFQASLAPQPAAGSSPPSFAVGNLASNLSSAINQGVIANGYYSSGSYQANNVDASTGLTVLLPSASLSDRLPETGPGSLSSYQTLYPGRGWTSFLAAWSATLARLAVLNQGSTPLELALVWEEGAIAAGADLDLWVLEPNGGLFIPYLGVVTPNGVLSGDSYETNTYYELYRTRQYVERGMYYFFGNLWTDPQDFRPLGDVAFRFGSATPWDWLYEDDLLVFSTQWSWLEDSHFSFQRILDDYYSDLQLVAYWDIRATTSAEESSVLSVSDPGVSATLERAGSWDGRRPPSLTSEQMRFLSELRTDPTLRALREANREAALRRGSPLDTQRAPVPRLPARRRNR